MNRTGSLAAKNIIMNGYDRFGFYLQQWERLLMQSSQNLNPALWLYNNNARTPLFMLEGLSKLYAGLHNKKKFTKLKEQFKLLEDALGAIDYYDNVSRELAQYPSIPAAVIDYLQAETREKVQHLNEIIQEKKWQGNNAPRLLKIRGKLDEANWLEPDKEIKAIEVFYKEAIESIGREWIKTGLHFTELESQLHELRRELRWLSIYPQALQGAVQLHDNGIIDFDTDKYLSPEIINSPFNKMPDRGNNRVLLLLEQKYFLSLSWLIAKLGTLKDKGLRVMAVSESLQQTENLSSQQSMTRACNLLGNDPKIIERILEDASQVCRLFFHEKNLQKLVAGIKEQ